ncbi:HoxN/HupN/NixA family nickel/cobalt transporter [Desulfotomaculum nigrificans]|uniref:HoxN/HupN/NixA family nickel/cobalt transporter n=1 Tax=Desulfotomaculum nigrificans TaxID=1565 RepID=UPI0001FAEA30|nr:HoxN/HupN/NixA family nickel/cobalt transporter [Desulfotomaculum nigrificans]
MNQIKIVNKTAIDRPKWFFYALAVLAIHILGLTLLITGAGDHPELLGMGFLTYTLGLRHAFDVDHIAAIDNTVRKLLQQREDPTGIGFFFSLGHSSVVFLMTLFTIFAMNIVQQELPQLKEIGGLIGTTVSGGFLLFLGLINLYIWNDIYRTFTRMRRGEFNEDNLEQLLLSRGLIARIVSPLYRFINKSWQVFPMGFLFGLGFDTASEVALLAISVGAARETIPLAGIISFPILFAAGMSLLDTADGVFMCNAYRWAFATPLRKIYYNLTITGVSVVVALFIGFVEVAQVLSSKIGLNGWVWNWVQNLDLNRFGYLLVFLFVLIWAVSFGLWKFLDLEKQRT